MRGYLMRCAFRFSAAGAGLRLLAASGRKNALASVGRPASVPERCTGAIAPMTDPLAVSYVADQPPVSGPSGAPRPLSLSLLRFYPKPPRFLVSPGEKIIFQRRSPPW